LLARRLYQQEQKCDKQFAVVFDAMRRLMELPPLKKIPGGFVHADQKEGDD